MRGAKALHRLKFTTGACRHLQLASSSSKATCLPVHDQLNGSRGGGSEQAFAYVATYSEIHTMQPCLTSSKRQVKICVLIIPYLPIHQEGAENRLPLNKTCPIKIMFNATKTMRERPSMPKIMKAQQRPWQGKLLPTPTLEPLMAL